MSMRTLDESDWSREVKARRLGTSIAVLFLAVACIAAALFWLVATMPNPVTFIDDVVVRPGVESSRVEVRLFVERCRAEQLAVDLKTAPTTSPKCAPLASYIRSTPVGNHPRSP